MKGPLAKRLATGLAVILVGLACLYGTMRAGLWNPSYASVAERYAEPPSRFVILDGAKIHYRVDGTGPTLMLLHGSFASLHEWDLVTQRLKGRFRIVRFDWPPYGLSLDPRGAHDTRRAAQLVAAMADHLNLDRFVLVGTSSGGNVALAYAAAHPERLRALAFSVLPIRPVAPAHPPSFSSRFMGWFFPAYLPNYHPRWYYRTLFRDVTGPGYVAPDWLVEDFYQENNWPGALNNQADFLAANRASFGRGEALAAAGRVTVPVLLQWAGQDAVIGPGSRGLQAKTDFARAPVTLIAYPDTGHFPMLEAPDRFSVDLAAFVDALPR